jgi:Protein kinase domain/WD40-like Beta Propeller Repeat
MSLTAGAHLGPYEVIAQIGAGGMGEVYRATDTNLGRQVAIKVLPEAFAQDAERLARFEREAKTLASLNHPNIAQIYGLEKSGGVQALVMELVEGEDLSQRIARGAIPLDEALPIAKQIAEAIEAAHEQGIIHRDLKPANIKVRSDGTVKVLDFGLAKLSESPAAASTGPSPLSMSPTIASPAMMTGVGVLLGTAAYMSPEQAKGRPADKRSDIWAFGAVLFEMLTGRRAFDGEDVSDALAAVLRAEPDWSTLPAQAAFPVRTLLRGCLEKDPQQRIGSMSAALFVLRHQTAGATIEAPAGYQVRRDVRRVALFITAALILGAAVAGTGVWWLTRSGPPSVVRMTIAASGASALVTSGLDVDVAITPDGSRVVYRGNNQLLVRALDQLQPTALSGLGPAQGVFLSPDGLWVGFFDGNTAIKKVSITGGPPETVCAVGQGVPTGATWGPDGTIIFATFAAGRGLQRVPAAGGGPMALTKVDRARGEGDHLWPEFLPGGEAVLYTIVPRNPNPSVESAQVAVLDLRTGTSKVLIRGGSHARYVPTGHLVYGVSGTLRAVAFDLERLEVVGMPALVLEGVVTTALGAVDIAVATNGSLVYVAGGAVGGSRQTVVSVDRQGRSSPLPGLPLDAYRTVRVSPDGTRLALATFDHVSIYDFARATLSRLTTAARDSSPLWTPDGQRIVFTSRRAGYPELFVRQADGTGREERLLGRARDLIDLLPEGWSKDGKQLLFSEVTPSIQCTIGQIAFERSSEVRLLVKNDGCNVFAAVSPDGRWIAYTSGLFSSRQAEVYVERYPELGNRQLISTGGGDVAVWSRDGRELFFKSMDGRQMFVVPMQSGTTLVAERPQMLFESTMPLSGGGYRPYDVAPDGRFLIIQRAQGEAGIAAAPEIVVVQNWQEELKRLVPTR